MTVLLRALQRSMVGKGVQDFEDAEIDEGTTKSSCPLGVLFGFFLLRR